LPQKKVHFLGVQVVDGGYDLQLWRVSANALNNQWRIANKGWSSDFEDDNCDLLADSSNTMNWYKNCYSQLLNVDRA
jgi:hypothetical protein